MAIVYLVRQETLEREVALKELSSFHASAPEMVKRFLHEAQLAGGLNHPNIVTVYEHFEDAGVPYIAMEHIPAGSFRPYLSRLTLAQFAAVMEGVLAGLGYAAGEGIVHRDLKPENIMVTAGGRVKIADFGIAKATESAGTGGLLTATGMTVGTPAYMAPEQAMGEPVGIWSDLYSVGVMAWEHVVGRHPFDANDNPMAMLMQQVNEQIPPAATVATGLDPAISAWIDRLLAKRPRDRIQSPSRAWNELEEIVVARLGPWWRRDADLPVPAPVAPPTELPGVARIPTTLPPTPGPRERPRRRTPWAMIIGMFAAAAGMLAAATVGVLLLASGSTASTPTKTTQTTITTHTSPSGGHSGRAILDGPWSSTVGPLTLTVTEITREGSTLDLGLKAVSTSSVTLPFYGSFRAVAPSGQTFNAPPQQPLNPGPGTPAATNVTLSDVQPMPSHLTVSFNPVFPDDSNYVQELANGVHIDNVPVPR